METASMTGARGQGVWPNPFAGDLLGLWGSKPELDLGPDCLCTAHCPTNLFLFLLEGYFTKMVVSHVSIMTKAMIQALESNNSDYCLCL